MPVIPGLEFFMRILPVQPIAKDSHLNPLSSKIRWRMAITTARR